MATTAVAGAGRSQPDVLLPADVIARSPSRREGVTEMQERAYRVFGCDLIAETSLLLRLPAAVSATAQTLLHRFLYRKPLTQFDAHIVALAAVFLAAKVEEHPRRMRDILNVCYRAKLRRQGKAARPLTLGGALYSNWKAALIRTERCMLKDLGFCLYGIMEHPHKFILYYLAALAGSPALAQRAWNVLNDSLRLDLCVRHSAESIATAAIYLASLTLPEPLPATVPWWEVFNTSKGTMLSIGQEMMQLYSEVEAEGPPRWLPSLRPDAVAGEDDEEGEAPLPPPTTGVR